MAWPVVELGDFCDTKLGKALNGKAPSGSETWPYLRNINVRWGSFDLSDIKQMHFNDRERNALRVEYGDLLICEGGEVGRCAIWREQCGEYYFQNAIHRVRPDPARCITDFLYYQMRFKAQTGGLREFTTQATIAHLSGEKLAKLPIILPPLAEQQRIVDILDRAAAIQRLRTAAEEKAREIIPALFVDIFGDPATNPKGWRTGYLPEVLIGGFRNGLYLPKDAYARRDGGSGVEMVHMSDLFKGMVERGSLKRVIVTDKQLADWSVCPDDLLLARRSLNFDGAARTTRISKSGEPLLFESSIIRLRPNRHVIHCEFLHYYLNDVSFRRSYVIPRITGATIYGINQKALSEMPVLIPPLQLQERFAARCKLLYDMSGLGTQASDVSERLLASAQIKLVGADD